MKSYCYTDDDRLMIVRENLKLDLPAERIVKKYHIKTNILTEITLTIELQSLHECFACIGGSFSAVKSLFPYMPSCSLQASSTGTGTGRLEFLNCCKDC